MNKKLLSMSVVGMMMLGGFSASAGDTISAVVEESRDVTMSEWNIDLSGVLTATNTTTDAVIATGVINDNSPKGWILNVKSQNLGKLIMPGTLREILYSTVKLVKTGGTLGTGLSLSAVIGDDGLSVTNAAGCDFNPSGTATTTATENYAFNLDISWVGDSSLPAGTYSDTITVTLTEDTI
jgi:hypothetical protein